MLNHLTNTTPITYPPHTHTLQHGTTHHQNSPIPHHRGPVRGRLVQFVIVSYRIVSYKTSFHHRQPKSAPAGGAKDNVPPWSCHARVLLHGPSIA